MSIDKAINNLSEILTEATEDENSICYVTENDAETLQVAINTMRKYKKIQELMAGWYNFNSYEILCAMYKVNLLIGEVAEDGNDKTTINE